MNAETVITMPGFRGRVTGTLGDMLVVDAQLDADMPAHAGETDEFAIVVSGHFELIMNGTTTAFGPGDHLVVKAGIHHAIRVIEPGRLVLIGKM